MIEKVNIPLHFSNFHTSGSTSVFLVESIFYDVYLCLLLQFQQKRGTPMTTSSATVPDAWGRELSTMAERYATGKALRGKVPHSSHAAWAPDPERPDPIGLLEKANQT
jgi:hypothetical protein